MSSGTELEEAHLLKQKIAELEARLLRCSQMAELEFRLLSDAAPCMIWRAGPDAVRNYVNPAWLDFRGRRIEEELNNRWTEGIHPDEREGSLAIYLQCFM